MPQLAERQELSSIQVDQSRSKRSDKPEEDVDLKVEGDVVEGGDVLDVDLDLHVHRVLRLREHLRVVLQRQNNKISKLQKKTKIQKFLKTKNTKMLSMVGQ